MPVSRKELNSIPDYVPGKSIDEIREKYGFLQVTKLASNENPFGTSRVAMAAYKKCAVKLHLYPRGSAPELVKKLALKWKVREENLIVGNGSDEILDLAARAYLNRGDYAVGANSTFSLYSSATKIAGAKYRAFPLENFYYPLEGLSSFKKAKIIFICNPNNPTGTYFSNKKIFDFLKKVPKEILVVLDMAYREFTDEDEPPMHKWIKLFPNLLCTRTFSKLYGLAGLRVGYGIASGQIIKVLKKIKPPFNSNYPAQMAAMAALDDVGFVEKSLKINSEERKKLTQNLQALGFEVLPSGANFVCAKIGKQAKELVTRLESKGVVIRHLSSFSMPEWVRITVGTPKQNGVLISKLQLNYEFPTR
jgi:histidinol-phosphate aminotransferase